MHKIAVLNQKGGVGKTTTVVNTAAALAQSGARVAILDLDPQSHLTIHLGLDPESIEAGSYKVLTSQSTIEQELMMVRPNLWLLPANVNLVGAETELVSVVGRETILREAVATIEDQFDFLIIDCAPSLGLLTLNALAAVKEVLIPLQPHFLALQGFGKLLHTVELVNNRINPELKVKGVLLCMFDGRASLPNEVKADIENFLSSNRGSDLAWAEANILPVVIRRNIKLAEAPSYGQTIFEYEENCHGAEDYKKVAEFFLNETEIDKPTQIIQDENSLQDIEIHQQGSESDSEILQQQSEQKPETVQQPDNIQIKQIDEQNTEDQMVIEEPRIEIQSISADRLKEEIAREIAQRNNHQGS